MSNIKENEMKKQCYIKEEIEHNDRIFILMLGHGKANLFRDLNERREKLVNKLIKIKENT